MRSYHRGPLRLPLEVLLGADFLPMLELRGIVPRHDRPSPDGGPGGFSLVGRDGVRRTTALRASPEPRVEAGGRLVFDLDLEPRGAIDLTLDFEVSEHADGELAAAIPHRPRVEDGTRLSSDDQLFNRILQRSLDDLELLRSELDGQSYYAAGTALVRDAVRPRQPDHGVRDALVRAGRGRGHAAAAGGPARDGGERRARRGARQGAPRAARGRAGGARRDARSRATTAASTPRRCSFACSGSYPDWSGNLDLFHELREPAEAALEWIDRYGDLDGDGLVEYQRRSEHGLVTQGWKDSVDGIPDAAGEPLAAPVALVEVQGYVARAKRMMARLFELDGDGARAERLREEAERVEAGLERFWLDGDGLLRDRPRRRQAARDPASPRTRATCCGPAS